MNNKRDREYEVNKGVDVKEDDDCIKQNQSQKINTCFADDNFNNNVESDRQNNSGESVRISENEDNFNSESLLTKVDDKIVNMQKPSKNDVNTITGSFNVTTNDYKNKTLMKKPNNKNFNDDFDKKTITSKCLDTNYLHPNEPTYPILNKHQPLTNQKSAIASHISSYPSPSFVTASSQKTNHTLSSNKNYNLDKKVRDSDTLKENLTFDKMKEKKEDNKIEKIEEKVKEKVIETNESQSTNKSNETSSVKKEESKNEDDSDEKKRKNEDDSDEKKKKRKVSVRRKKEGRSEDHHFKLDPGEGIQTDRGYINHRYKPLRGMYDEPRRLSRDYYRRPDLRRNDIDSRDYRILRKNDLDDDYRADFRGDYYRDRGYNNEYRERIHNEYRDRPINSDYRERGPNPDYRDRPYNYDYRERVNHDFRGNEYRDRVNNDFRTNPDFRYSRRAAREDDESNERPFEHSERLNPDHSQRERLLEQRERERLLERRALEHTVRQPDYNYHDERRGERYGPPLDALRPRVEEPDINDAMGFLEKVKLEYKDEKVVYDQFLEIMKTYKEGNLTITGVMRAILSMFKDKQHLIEEFNKFLPRAYRFDERADRRIRNNYPVIRPPPERYVPRDTEPFYRSEPMRTLPRPVPLRQDDSSHTKERKALEFMKKVRQRLEGQPAKLKEFVNALRKYQMAPTKPASVLLSLKEMLFGHHDLLAEFDEIIPKKVAESAKELVKEEKETPIVETEDDKLFNKISEILKVKGVMDEFLRLLNMYYQEMITGRDFVFLLKNVIQDDGLIAAFKNFIKYQEYDLKPYYLKNLRKCKQLFSYRILPERYRDLECKGQDAIAKEVLNQFCVSCPTMASEESTFVSSKKNVYEENLYRVEDERYETERLKLRLSDFIVVLESLNLNIEQNKEIKRLSLSELCIAGGIVEEILKEIYGDKSNDILDGLLNSPRTSIPILLNRFYGIVAQQKRDIKDRSGGWRSIINDNCYKALNCEDVDFRGYEKKLDLKGIVKSDVKVKITDLSIFDDIEKLYMRCKSKENNTNPELFKYVVGLIKMESIYLYCFKELSGLIRYILAAYELLFEIKKMTIIKTEFKIESSGNSDEFARMEKNTQLSDSSKFFNNNFINNDESTLSLTNNLNINSISSASNFTILNTKQLNNELASLTNLSQPTCAANMLELFYEDELYKREHKNNIYLEIISLIIRQIDGEIDILDFEHKLLVLTNARGYKAMQVYKLIKKIVKQSSYKVDENEKVLANVSQDVLLSKFNENTYMATKKDDIMVVKQLTDEEIKQAVDCFVNYINGDDKMEFLVKMDLGFKVNKMYIDGEDVGKDENK